MGAHRWPGVIRRELIKGTAAAGLTGLLAAPARAHETAGPAPEWRRGFDLFEKREALKVLLNPGI